MRNLTQYIQEKLHPSKFNKEKQYKYHPETRDELKDFIKKLIEERGPNADLNDIDTSEITDMSGLFQDSEFNGDISKWDVSNVTDMKSMFENSEFNGNISGWDVSNVEDMNKMFKDSKFNKDISKWNVSNVKNFSWMFAFSKFNQINVTKWNLIHLTKNEQIEKMFYKSTLWNRHFEKIPHYMNIY